MLRKITLLILVVLFILPCISLSQQLFLEWTHMNPVRIHDMEFMPDHNTFLVTTSGELQIRSTETGEILETYPFGSQELEFTPDSTRLISYFRDTLFIRNLDDFSLIKTYIIPPNEEEWSFNFHGLQVDPIRPYIYVIREANEKFGMEPRFTFRRILMFNYETMQLEADLTPEGFEKRLCEKIAISRDGKYLAGITEGNSKIVIWDLDSRTVYKERQICPYYLEYNDWGNPRCVKFSQLDNDKIYISGIFPKGVNIPVFSGIYIYSIKSNSIIDSTFNIVKGYFDFFDIERRMIYTNGWSMFVINLESMIIELTDGIYNISAQIIYSQTEDIFIGRGYQHISKIGYIDNTSIDDDYEGDTIYPNPTKDKVNINFDCDSLEFTWQLFNFEGTLLKESKELNQKEIDLTNYPNGVYLLHLQYDGQEITIKIVKEG
jgi:hypothetical protein